VIAVRTSLAFWRAAFTLDTTEEELSLLRSIQSTA